MKKIYLRFIPLIFFLVIGIALPVIFSHSISSSDEMTKDTGYYINSYDVEIDVGENGVYDIFETIEVIFRTPSQGIFRYLPIYQTARYYDKSGKFVSRNYKNNITGFQILSGDKWSYESNGDFVVYRIGTRGVYHTGIKRYQLLYTIDPGDDRDSSMDMFYYNIIGTGWDTSIENVNFVINFEKAIENDFKMYVGYQGESDESSRVVASLSDDGKRITGYTTDVLEFGEGLTIFKAFENGYFKHSRSYLFDIIMIVVILICAAGILFMYFKYKQKIPVIPVVNFAAPKGMTPTEVGYLNDEEITGDDLSALLVYWASKGYVKIIEKNKNISIQKLKDLPVDSKDHEKILFEDIFRNKNKVSAKNLNLSLNTGYNCSNSVQNEMALNFSNSKSVISKCQSFVLFAIFLLFAKSVFQSYIRDVNFIIHGVVYIALLVIISLVGVTVQNRYKKGEKRFWREFIAEIVAIYGLLIAFMFMMEGYNDPFLSRIWIAVLPILYLLLLLSVERYSEEGKKLLGDIRGLKTFIENAEKDRMEMLVNDDPSLFFEILPYAYVLGVSDVYMKKFENVDIVKPDWYESSGKRFTIVHLTTLNNSFGSISQACSTRYQSQNKSSSSSHRSSGFGGGGGGGGFSGGGFGGGGGGRW